MGYDVNRRGSRPGKFIGGPQLTRNVKKLIASIDDGDLENALYNVEHNIAIAKPIVISQLKNAIAQLERDPDASKEFDDAVAEH